MVLKIRYGASVAATTEGAISFDLENHVLLLDRILVLPKVYKNIIFISSMTGNGYLLAIFMGKGYLHDDLYLSAKGITSSRTCETNVFDKTLSNPRLL